MEKINLNNRNTGFDYAAATTNACTCLECGGCLICITFIFFSPAALGISLGFALNRVQSPGA